MATVSVVHAEQEKNLKKAQATEQYYSDLYAYWNDYKQQYSSQVEQLREQNRQDMLATKQAYEDLLAKQPQLIQDHTRTVQETSYVETQQTGSTSQNKSSSTKTTSTTTKKQVISVPKPSSKPTTGAS